MSRSHHVTRKKLNQERISNALIGDRDSEMTELERADIKKRITKVNSKWQRAANKAGMHLRRLDIETLGLQSEE